MMIQGWERQEEQPDAGLVMLVISRVQLGRLPELAA